MTIAAGALRPGQGPRTVVTIDTVARPRVRVSAAMTEGATTVLARMHLAAAPLASPVIATSALVRRLLGPDPRIVEASAVMIALGGRRIAPPLAVPAIRARSVTIAARARRCAVAMTAIRSVIRGFPMTSRQRILIAVC